MMGSPVSCASRTAVYRYGMRRDRSSRYFLRMISTCGLFSSAGSARHCPDSNGPPSPPFQPQGSFRCQFRPCARNDGQNAPNWNQRTCSSPVYSAVGLKPPMSVPQYGNPDKPVLMPTATWVFKVCQNARTSPDQM